MALSQNIVKGGTTCLALVLLSCGSTVHSVPTHKPTAAAITPRVYPTGVPAIAVSPGIGYSVEIPSLNINLPIVEGEGGTTEPPLDVAAHYPGMKWPGEGGRSFLYAHARAGMFGALLESGAVGQTVNVTTPKGVLHYTIVMFTRHWNVADTSILQPADHEELVLYTCTSWAYRDPKVVAIAEEST